PLGQSLTLPLNSASVQALPVVQAMPLQAGGVRSPYPQFDQNLPLYRALLPKPQYPQIVDDASPTTSSTYNAGYIKAQKRFSSGLSFLTNFTVSKYLSDTMWAPGRRFLGNTGLIGKMVLSGWTVSAIQQYESGPPAVLDGYQSIPVPLTPSITTSGSRADRVVGVPVRSSTSCRDIRYGDRTNPR